MYQDAFREVLEDQHSARLIMPDRAPKKPVKRDYVKYQKLLHIKKTYRSQR